MNNDFPLLLLIFINKYLYFLQGIFHVHIIIHVFTQVVSIVVIRLATFSLIHVVWLSARHFILKFLLGRGTQDLREVKVTRKLRLLSALIDHDVACLVVGVAVLDHVGALVDA